jgi:site-specific DNA-methyltransferase (adenine-specific)
MGSSLRQKADVIDFLQSINQPIDCFFADPPFNLAKNYGSEGNDKRIDYLDWCKAWLDLAIAKLKDGGSLFVYNLPKWNFELATHCQKTLEFRHWIAIDMKNSMPIKGRLYPAHYGLIYFTKGKPRVFNKQIIPVQRCRHCDEYVKDYGGRKKIIDQNNGVSLSDVWHDLSPVRHAKYKNRKANELSYKIVERAVLMSTNEGDLVVDPFVGSGTTERVCTQHNRRWLTSDING